MEVARRVRAKVKTLSQVEVAAGRARTKGEIVGTEIHGRRWRASSRAETFFRQEHAPPPPGPISSEAQLVMHSLLSSNRHQARMHESTLRMGQTIARQRAVGASVSILAM